MKRYVSLTCDEKPTYAWLLPVAAKLWETLGYVPIVQHRLSEGNAFEAAVLAWTPGLKIQVAERPPMSVANTMRALRLYAWPHVSDADDFILTSDVDMFPLSRTFFQGLPSHVVLRAAWYLWLGRQDGQEPVIGSDTFEWSNDWLERPRMRLPMCYVGLPRSVWQTLFPRTLEEAVQYGTEAVLDRLPSFWASYDDPSWDESELTQRLMRYVAGQPLETLARGRWKKGELLLVDPLDLPNHSVYQNMPRGLLRLGDKWKPDLGPRPENVIDFIPPRMAQHDHSLWVFDVVKLWYPELSGWCDSYVRDVESTLKDAQW